MGYLIRGLTSLAFSRKWVGTHLYMAKLTLIYGISKYVNFLDFFAFLSNKEYTKYYRKVFDLSSKEKKRKPNNAIP